MLEQYGVGAVCIRTHTIIGKPSFSILLFVEIGDFDSKV